MTREGSQIALFEKDIRTFQIRVVLLLQSIVLCLQYRDRIEVIVDPFTMSTTSSIIFQSSTIFLHTSLFVYPSIVALNVPLIVLCSQFRMIFVCLAYENVKSHTAAFFGLQVALMLVALQNTLFIWDDNIKYEQIGSDIKHTRHLALAFLTNWRSHYLFLQDHYNYLRGMVMEHHGPWRLLLFLESVLGKLWILFG